MLRTSRYKALVLLGLLVSTTAFAIEKEPAKTDDHKPVVTPAGKDNPMHATPGNSDKASPKANGSSDKALPTATNGSSDKSSPSVAKGPVSSVTCTPCHAADGNADNPAFPKISGLAASYTMKQLQEFKKGPNGKRNNAVMLTIANQLSDHDMQELAEYYAKQVRTIGVANSSNIELGQRIYRAGNIKTGVTACAACHLPDGEGNEAAGFPKLSGQNAQYIATQLHAFKAGERANDLNGIMQAIAKRMSDEEIEAVSNYVSGLH